MQSYLLRLFWIHLLIFTLFPIFCDAKGGSYAVDVGRTDNNYNIIIEVPDDYTSIQEAIDAANPGDTVYVSPGNYLENIRLKSYITVSAAGPESTRILGATSSPVVEAIDVEGTLIEGFSLRGRGISQTGVYVENSQITIRNNWISYVFGEGIWCIYSKVAIENNMVSDNWGSGIHLSKTHPESVVLGNNILNNGWAGVKVLQKAHGSIRDNLISGNGGSGIHAEIAGIVNIETNTISNNKLSGVTCYTVSKLDLGAGRTGSIGHNCIYGNGIAAIWNVTRLIDAKYNWWGTPEPDESFFEGSVDWSEMLTEEPSSCRTKSNLKIKTQTDNARVSWHRDSTSENIPPEWKDLPPRKIIFESCRYGQYEIVTVDTVSSELSRLTYSPRSDELPNWKPDGSWTVFSSQYRPFYDLYMINGEERVQITDHPEQHDMAPAWHPSESRIAYHTFLSGTNSDIIVVDIVEQSPGPEVNLTSDEYVNGGVSWSPDGSQLAFYSNRMGNMDLFTMHNNGSNIYQITTNRHGDLQPSWSPDGKTILFHSSRDGNAEIYEVNLDTLKETRLTFHPADDYSPSWASDQKNIAFHSNRNGNYDIIGMNADGTGQVRITSHPCDDMDPQWSLL